MLRGLLTLVLLCSFAIPAWADDAELHRLQSILATLNQQLESTYRQFQMLQEVRRNALQTLNAPRPGLDSRSYDELEQERQAAIQQQREVTQQMNQLLAKARAIEAQINPLLERVYQLIPEGATPPPLPALAAPPSKPTP